ncbi:TetR-like C-terminal domain-containing protein [Nonomuraea sp. B19D2]|uniref:TetR-like C-terminal domain-containing protein n=1 Tax=Nonomuraea sp. B19D2 TaxID=3159561 RepID=UPI0032DB6496
MFGILEGFDAGSRDRPQGAADQATAPPRPGGADPGEGLRPDHRPGRHRPRGRWPLHLYAHYTDKDDLLLGNLEELATALEEHMERHFASRAEPNPVLAAFQHADRQRDLYKAVAGKRGAEVMRTGLRRRIKEVMARRMPEFLPHRDGAVPVDVTMEFLPSSLLGLLVWRLDDDLPYTAEQMADMYLRFVVPGVQAVYGI